MDVLDDAAGELLAIVVVTLVGYLGSWLPGRRLWRLGHPQRDRLQIRIYVSVRTPEDTGHYLLPVVGLGQVLAIGAIAPSLARGYRRLGSRLPSIVPATDVSARDLTGNVLLLGGASHNSATRRLLERCEPSLGIRQIYGDANIAGDRLFIRQADQSWRALGGKPRDTGVGPITDDYALIIRTRNPWDNDRASTCVLFAGVHTYGTAAAAQYFAQQWWKPRWWFKREILMVIKVAVEDDHIIRIEPLENIRRLPWGIGVPSSGGT